jgi:hypothetical protein
MTPNCAPKRRRKLARVSLTIRDDTYWRADSQPGQHANAPILSVARVGTHIIVEEVDYSHARGGGWYVWVKARSSG